jgi:endonuclease/exonuclease/phosphatase family metal-dependent hydrolase
MKLISLNIEAHKHLEERLIPFLKAEQPEVVCVQELFYVDIARIVAETGLTLVHYVPVADVTEPNRHIPDALGWWGNAQFIQSDTIAVEPLPMVYYKGQSNIVISDTLLSQEEVRSQWSTQQVPHFMGDADPNAANRVVLHMNVTTPLAKTYHIMTTHFTWSPGGTSTPEQKEHATSLVNTFSEKTTNTIFCGDFNAPRGGETFQILASRWKDNIPLNYTTSLDQNLHKGGKLQLMVDGLFSDPEVQFSSVRLQDGVSDHMAIVAEVS